MEAFRAGSEPDTRPIIAETPIPKTIFPVVNSSWNDKPTEFTIKVSNKMINKPAIPPSTAKNTASNKNCKRIK